MCAPVSLWAPKPRGTGSLCASARHKANQRHFPHSLGRLQNARPATLELSHAEQFAACPSAQVIPFPAMPSDADPEHAMARRQIAELLERAVDGLPDGFRVVFVMRAIEEMSVEETATALGIPEATVRSRFFRARGLLREALAREVDLSVNDAFAFDGARCDRLVAAVMQKIAGPA